ncbi:hypothetical protein N8H22_15650 [Stutzerimonas stutzeri]|uniref:hypothetical protein n=1 Tax=Stutzerimonas sp. S1 TaxID=3030652 RepID=UPI00222583E6|nr:hypothetical protein [Stutzerimonas sp. S1]MCW3150040.1 hypothetical protein [Stutzerimonas sp. S1]
MSRLPILLVVLTLLSGCTVYGHGDHGYQRPYYHGVHREHRHDVYPTRYYYYERPDYRRYAPPPPVRYDRHEPRHDYSKIHDRHSPRYQHHRQEYKKFQARREAPRKEQYHAKSRDHRRQWRHER